MTTIYLVDLSESLLAFARQQTPARFSYLAMLLFCAVGSGWLELVLHTRVCARWQRLVLAVLPTAVVFGLWDRYALLTGHWWIDPAQTTSVWVPGGLPLEEALFFLVVPTCAVLTFEAVRARRPDWSYGDEPFVADRVPR